MNIQIPMVTKQKQTAVPDYPALIAVQAQSKEQEQQARQLAQQLDLPMWREGEFHPLLLRITQKRLEIIKPGDPLLTGAIWAEFVNSRAQIRRKQSRSQLLARAVGIKAGHRLLVADATGGLGRDGFLLAAAGCQVLIFERNKVIAKLLADGLRRADEDASTQSICARIRLFQEDFCLFWASVGNSIKPEVVYLDPMFPEKKKTAKAKKELQILQLLAGPETDTNKLFQAALKAAEKRVVVKRPPKAPFLANIKPSHCLSGKTVRFDVYML